MSGLKIKVALKICVLECLSFKSEQYQQWKPSALFFCLTVQWQKFAHSLFTFHLFITKFCYLLFPSNTECWHLDGHYLDVADGALRRSDFTLNISRIFKSNFFKFKSNQISNFVFMFFTFLDCFVRSPFDTFVKHRILL